MSRTRQRGGQGPSPAARQAQAEQGRRLEEAAAKRRQRRLIALIVVATVILLAIVAVVAVQVSRSRSTPDAGPGSGRRFGRVTPQNGKPLVFGGGAHTMSLYFDAHCSHCLQAEDKLGATIAKQVEAGHVALALYPMAFIDDGSSNAARGLACAADAGYGWEFYQRLWGQNARSAWTDAQVVALGKALAGGASADDFERCVTRKKMQGWVDSIGKAADEAKVTSTPQFFLDGNTLEWDSVSPAELEKKLS